MTVCLFLLFILCTHPALGLGTQELSFTLPQSTRSLVAELYYPSKKPDNLGSHVHGLWMRENYTKDAPFISNQKRLPLIIFSHGFQGDRFGQSWLAESFVKKDYIVAMIDHTHNTSYDHHDVFIYSSMWQRPLDISGLLTYLLSHPSWEKVIDRDRIVAMGFSLGGLTALWLGGAQADTSLFKKIMDERYARWKDWPESIKEKARQVDWGKAAQSYHDPRIKAVVALAPDIGEGFTHQGVLQLKSPTLILVGDQDRVTPLRTITHSFTTSPKAQLVVLKNAHHFSFMNRCSPLGERLTHHLCQDTNVRAQLQNETFNLIKTFLDKTFPHTLAPK